MNEKRLRLISGLVLAVYVIPHVINHTLGLISIQAMDAMQEAAEVVWRNPLGTAILYGSFALHFGLGLWSLYRRTTLRMPAWEAVQLTFGLMIWPLLLGHAMGTRVAHDILDISTGYDTVIAVLWLQGSTGWIRQTVLLIVVWVHLALGLHYWLRLYAAYRRIQWLAYALAVAIPVLSIAGFFRAGLEMTARHAADPGLLDRMQASRASAPADAHALYGSIETGLWAVILGLIALTLVARIVRRAWRNRHGRFALSLPDGRTVRAPVGATVLEAIRAAGIPHAAVCGGRGRCTTCRIRVGTGRDDLPPPGDVERAALTRVGAPAGMRLACQVRPQRDATIAPLLPPHVAPTRVPGGVNGQEQAVVIVFIDLRGSTRLGERRLPYDVLFILNQYFAEMAAALRETGGHYAQFAGDGLMALYGIDGGVTEGARAALAGAAAMLRRLDDLNARLADELEEPLRMGVGIHCGEAIVGTMGPPAAPILSAIGDNVNIAARLESLTKELAVPVVASDAAVRAADVDTAGLVSHQVTVAGRSAPLRVYGVPDPAALAAMAS